MIIDFSNISETVIKNFHEGKGTVFARMYVDDSHRIMSGRLEPGSSIGLHLHDKNCEIIYILKGVGTVMYDQQYEEIQAGCCHYCPKGHAHSLINNGDSELAFFAVVA